MKKIRVIGVGIVLMMAMLATGCRAKGICDFCQKEDSLYKVTITSDDTGESNELHMCKVCSDRQIVIASQLTALGAKTTVTVE